RQEVNNGKYGDSAEKANRFLVHELHAPFNFDSKKPPDQHTSVGLAALCKIKFWFNAIKIRSSSAMDDVTSNTSPSQPLS
ncbi:hypothetical protein, partial [Ligilactobacillus salivarius]|uniref:hypothetical protein n=1 Tax=Ligilactobacillus salivarius TaxID=1624 RepID=UPI0026733DAE